LSFGHKDKLLEKDVAKSKISSDDAQAIKNRVTTVTNVSELAGKDIQLAMEVRLSSFSISPSICMAENPALKCQPQAVSESLPLKQKIFSGLAEHCGPDAILATNTSSISISKIAASAVKPGAGREEAFRSSSRCLGM
jgi:3-hydroxybutyryl-CoA dehydrogenase